MSAAKQPPTHTCVHTTSVSPAVFLGQRRLTMKQQDISSMSDALLRDRALTFVEKESQFSPLDPILLRIFALKISKL